MEKINTRSRNHGLFRGFYGVALSVITNKIKRIIVESNKMHHIKLR